MIHTSHDMSRIPGELNRMCMNCNVCECHDPQGLLEGECTEARTLA